MILNSVQLEYNLNLINEEGAKAGSESILGKDILKVIDISLSLADSVVVQLQDISLEKSGSQFVFYISKIGITNN